MRTRIDNLIEQIKQDIEPRIADGEEIRVIIGNDEYGDDIDNIDARGITIYDNYGFEKIAFLTETKNLNLVAIVGILLDSIDDAVELVKRIVDNQETTMEKFAIFLAQRRIILVNHKGNTRKLLKLFSNCANAKVLYIGSKGKAKYQEKVSKSLWLPHCSGQTYGTCFEECYKSYFEHDYEGNQNGNQINNLKIADFSIWHFDK